jgi:[acyl-carrier-protein] S-malonyltransferase
MKLGLFPGQGVALKAVLDALPANHPMLQEASATLCYDLRKRVEFVARRPRAVMPTSLAQPAIFTASLISYSETTETFDCFLGHSVGEYAALVAGGSLSFAQALCVVQVRGDAMEKAATRTNGGMVAVIGIDLDEAEAIAAGSGVSVANDNSPQQVVLAGDDDALAEAATQARARGGRAVRLDVTGPFHTPQVAAAAPLLRDVLEHVSIRSPRVPVISNVSADAYRAPGEIRKLLIEQLTSRVRFRDALEGLWLKGVTDFFDFGPGQVVAGLASKTFGPLRSAASVSVG